MHCILSYDTVFRFDDVAIVQSVSRLCMTMLDCVLLLNPYGACCLTMMDHGPLRLDVDRTISEPSGAVKPASANSPTPFHKSGKTIELVSLSSPLVGRCWKNPTSARTVARSRFT